MAATDTPPAATTGLPDVSDTPCPGCGEKSLTIEMRLTAAPVGAFSLAGVGMKFAATSTPWISCASCGIEAEGKVA